MVLFKFDLRCVSCTLAKWKKVSSPFALKILNDVSGNLDKTVLSGRDYFLGVLKIFVIFIIKHLC